MKLTNKAIEQLDYSTMKIICDKCESVYIKLIRNGYLKPKMHCYDIYQACENEIWFISKKYDYRYEIIRLANSFTDWAVRLYCTKKDVYETTNEYIPINSSCAEILFQPDYSDYVVEKDLGRLVDIFGDGEDENIGD